MVRTFAVAITAYLLPGVRVDGFMAAAVTAVVLGVLNILVRPVLLILTIPINIMTLGLFTFVINSFIVLMAANIVPGFGVETWGTAFLFSIVLALVSWFLDALERG